MDPNDELHPGSGLRERIFGCKTSAEIAEIVVECFEAIEQALGPIVGSGGVVALFNRSVHLASVRRAWLRSGAEPSLVALDLVALGKAFARQDLEEAAIGGSDLLYTFRTLLATFIGDSLTEKLLQPAWTRFSQETAIKKASP